LAEIDRTARQQVEQTMAELLKTNPAPDKMSDPLKWVQHQNAIKAQAEEIVIPSLIYS
ncbi:TnpV protein, partial [Butyricicoccus sp. 1XD8-22]